MVDRDFRASLISHRLSEGLCASITGFSPCAIRVIVEVAAGKLSQVMNNSSDCLKTFAFLRHGRCRTGVSFRRWRSISPISMVLRCSSQSVFPSGWGCRPFAAVLFVYRVFQDHKK